MHNNIYIGSSTSNDAFLMHYGVKGMKWGIRKRIVSNGVQKPHSLHYHIAQRKLMKLQKEEARDIAKVQSALAKGKNRKIKKAYQRASEKLEELSKNANRDYQRGQREQMKEDQSRLFWWSDSSRGFGSGPRANTMLRIMNRMDGRKSKKLISDKGHAEAVKTRNRYARRMKKMFAGTAYAQQTRAAAKKRVRIQK